MDYQIQITPQMQAVSAVLIEECVGIDHCIIGLGRNIVVEVARSNFNTVLVTLKKHFPDVVDIRKAYLMIDDLHDFILVKPMVSEAPLFEQDSFVAPTLEKQLVDRIADKEYAGETDEEKLQTYQRSFEQYPVNLSRLLRYAARKGKKEEVQQLLSRLNKERIEVIHSLCHILADAPVQRAWIFGSFARMEERPDSDVDLLVDFDKDSHLGLMALSSLIEKLEEGSGRKVDLVANGSLKSFAKSSVERDKVLVYERAS